MLLDLKQEVNEREDKKQNIELINDNVVYTKAGKGQLVGIYYLLS